jgi:endonuclease/exonuclease/phosphatase family metal-dependent hydrolase
LRKIKKSNQERKNTMATITQISQKIAQVDLGRRIEVHAGLGWSTTVPTDDSVKFQIALAQAEKIAQVLCPEEAADNDSAKPRFTVVAYNIKHGQGMDGNINLPRIAEVLRRLSPDIVTLQEVDRCCSRSGRIDQAATLGDLLQMYACHGEFLPLQGGSYGMAVLSRYPFIATFPHHLPEGDEPRCALEGVISLDEGRSYLSVVGIHNDTQGRIRKAQVQTLLEALQDRTHPIILAGDFNGARSDPSLQCLAHAGWHILDKQGKYTWPAPQPTRDIDFVVTRGDIPLEGIQCDVCDESLASDHRPVVAMIPLRSLLTT